MSITVVLDWIARLSACSLLVQTLELWKVRASFSERGIYRQAELRRDLVALPSWLRTPLAVALGEHAFLHALRLQLVLCGVTLLLGCTPVLIVSFLLALLVCVRFGGSYNGGSDSMTLLTLLALAVAGGVPSTTAQRAAVYYIAVQTCLSYFLAGVVKLREASWHNGHALASFVQLTRYGAPAEAKQLAQHAWFPSLAGFVLIAFECSFPFALLLPRWAQLYLALGVCFHALNSWLLGLNRFLWAWTATYPAIWYVSQ
jgi:hypothetical protein